MPLDNSRWWDDGACATEEFKDLALALGAAHPSDIFFPITETDDGRPIPKVKAPLKYTARQERFEQLALRTCSTCPVRRECLLDAAQSDTDIPWGISGGLGPRQRVDLLDGAKLISHRCPGCNATLWGTPNFPPNRTCGVSCANQ